MWGRGTRKTGWNSILFPGRERGAAAELSDQLMERKSEQRMPGFLLMCIKAINLWAMSRISGVCEPPKWYVFVHFSGVHRFYHILTDVSGLQKATDLSGPYWRNRGMRLSCVFPSLWDLGVTVVV